MIYRFAGKYGRKCSDLMANCVHVTLFQMTIFGENSKNPELLPKQLHSLHCLILDSQLIPNKSICSSGKVRKIHSDLSLLYLKKNEQKE